MYESVYRLQSSHWWYLGRKAFLEVLLSRVRKGGRVLDAGCGPGALLGYLERYGETVGVDRHLPALVMARQQFAGPLVQGDLGRLPFRDGEFSLVVACEVLYHRNIPDVRRALAELVRVLEPGGSLLVVDSAYEALMSAHDEAAHGARRFTRREMISLFRDAGLDVAHATYAYALLLPVVWAVRRAKCRLPQGRAKVELRKTWSPLNRGLAWWFALEARLAGRWGLPCGLSVQVLGRKR